MCLTTKRIFPKIAWKDIECYKVLEYDKNKNTYYTPFQFSPIYPDTISNKQYFIAESWPILSYERHYLLPREVGAGYIHSYNLVNVANRNKQLNDIIVKCIIPRFTLYFEGECNDYASKKIQFIEILRS